MSEMTGRIRSRVPYLVAYLGVTRNEQSHDKLRTALAIIEVIGTPSLEVTWKRKFDGQVVATVKTTSFAHRAGDHWRLYLRAPHTPPESDPAWERLAGVILLACEFPSTEKASDVRDILIYAEDRLREKLTNLGIAPETVADAERMAFEQRPPPVAPPSVPDSPPIRPNGPIPAIQSPPVHTPPEVVTPATPPGIPPRPPLPPPPQRDHTEARKAETWLRDELQSRLRNTGWEVSAGAVAIGRSYVDIVLTGPITRCLIEVKQVQEGDVYWREEQIETAQAHRDVYVIALVSSSAPDTHEVRWVWDPLSDFAELQPSVSWYWKEQPAPGGLGDDWRPIDSPPCVEPERFKAVVTLSEHYRMNLPADISALLGRLEIRP